MSLCLKKLLLQPSSKYPEGHGLDTKMPAGVIIETMHVPGLHWGGDRGYVNRVTPKSASSTRCCLFVHGGGFTNGSPNSSYRPFSAQLAKNSGLVFFVPDYTLVPDAQYPVQLDQVLSLARRIQKKYKNIVLMGDSAGGTIALSAALKEPQLFERCLFLSPWINLKSSTLSYKPRQQRTRNGVCGDPVFRGTAREVATRSRENGLRYLGKASLERTAPANPAMATKAMLRSLPPSLFMVGDRETLRGEVMSFVGEAQTVNKHIYGQLYDGMWHDWPMYSDGCGSKRPVKSSKLAIAQIASFLSRGELDDPAGVPTVSIILQAGEDIRRKPSTTSRKRPRRRSRTQGKRPRVSKRRTKRKS